MKIKLLAQYAGPRGVFNPGDVLDLPDVEAQALVQGRYAVDVTPVVVTPALVYVPPAPVAVETIETADLPDAAEKAVPKRRPKKV